MIGKTGAQGEPVAQAHAEAPAVPFAAPAQAAYEWEKSGLMVSIDAKVFVPNVDRYPIYGASNEAWSQQQLDAIVNSLTKGSQLYDANSAVYTEEELLEMLLWEQRLLSEVQSGQNTTYVGSIEHIQQNIETLQDELASLGDKRPTAIDVSDYQDIKQERLLLSGKPPPQLYNRQLGYRAFHPLLSHPLYGYHCTDGG